MPTQKTAKQKITTTVSSGVLAATGHRGATRKIGQEIDAAFQERDALRIENAALKEQLATMQAIHGAALAMRDQWIENVCATLNELPKGEWIFWRMGEELKPPTAPESPG